MGNVGSEAVSLFEQAADVALDADEGGAAAFDLSCAASILQRFPGLVAYSVPPERPGQLVERARHISDGSVRAVAAIAVADGWSTDSEARSSETVTNAWRGTTTVATPSR